MLDELAARVETKDVDTGLVAVTGPLLVAVQDDEIAIGEHASSIPLVSGSNIITVTARDSPGNTGIDTLTVTYATTTPTVTLTAVRGSSWKMVSLTWTSVSWPSVDSYRNNVLIKNKRNTGSTSDTVPSRGSYAYNICAPGSTTVCSNVAGVNIQ